MLCGVTAIVFGKTPHTPPFNSLCDALGVVWTQRIVDRDKVVGAVVLHVEKRESDKYGFVR